MTLIHRLGSIVRWLIDRDRAEQRLDAELRTFVELSAADKIRDGVAPDEALRLATLELGGAEQVKEQVRSGRHGASLDEAGRDVRYAFRTFRRNPGFATVVIATLALGIGANTAIFSLIDALMLRWLPVPNPQEILQIKMRLPDDKGAAGDSFSYAAARALADQKEIFSGAAGFSAYVFMVGHGTSIAKVPGALVTGSYYQALGLAPAVGRLLTTADDDPGAPLAAVISDGYWERQFARSPSAVGQSLLLNGAPATIVGVGPRGFVGANVGAIADVTTTIGAFGAVNRMVAEISGPGNFWLRVLARPARGVSVDQATARLAVFWSRNWDSIIAAHWPASRRSTFAAARFQLDPGGTGWTFMRQMYQKPLMVLMAAVALVLLIACANVASLLLARASARQREMAVRLAMGAGRGRIARQLLIESTLLSSMGAVLGMLLAWASSRLLVNAISSGRFQPMFDLTPNLHVLAFTAAAALATGVSFGLAPAFQASGASPAPALKDDAHMAASRSLWLPSLIAGQVALSLLLLVGAGLFVRTLRNLQQIDPGFNREGVLLVDLQERRTPVPTDVLDAVQRVPGIVSASVSTHTPLSGSTWSDIVVPKGQAMPERDTAFFIGAGPRFFETMQTPILAGREFGDGDGRSAVPVAIVNETFARRYFPNQQPVGQYLSAEVRGERRDLEIIGLAGNTSTAGLRRAPPATVYVSYRQLTSNFSTTLEVRAAGPLAALAETVRATVQSRLPETAVEVRPLSAQVDDAMTQERMMAKLAGAFGMLALILACIGLYGLEAYSVERRTKEMGIRIALGAPRGRVVGIVIANALRLVAIGVTLGLPAALAASRGVRSMLFGLQPADPATIGGAILVLTAAALAAAYVPARRASRVDPIVALRHE